MWKDHEIHEPPERKPEMVNGAPLPLRFVSLASAVRALSVAGFLFLLVFPLHGATTKTVVCFGDSLTAGYGLDDPGSQAFPALLQSKIEKAALPYRVVNAGLSGETTAGGLRRVDWILRQSVDVFILALGGNDGMRGIEP